MKNIWLRVALTSVLAALPAWTAAQTADEVVEKHLAAIGGRQALGKLQSRIVNGSIVLSTPGGEVAGTVEIYGKAPNKSRTVIKVDLSALGAGQLVVDQRFDGTTGYILDTLNGNRDMTGNQLENQRNAFFPTPLLAYKEHGAKVELIGREKVAGRDAYVVQFTPSSGSAIKQFFDVETYLLAKSVVTVNVPQLGRDVEQTAELSDYREVDGVKIPHKTVVASAVQNFTITVEKVQHNTDIDDKSFAKPAPEK
jgi:hypothetical protein